MRLNYECFKRPLHLPGGSFYVDQKITTIFCCWAGPHQSPLQGSVAEVFDKAPKTFVLNSLDGHFTANRPGEVPSADGGHKSPPDRYPLIPMVCQRLKNRCVCSLVFPISPFHLSVQLLFQLSALTYFFFAMYNSTSKQTTEDKEMLW